VDWGLGFLGKGQIWLGCSDRIVLLSADFKPVAEIFLLPEGLAALAYSEGVYVANERIGSPFQAMAHDGTAGARPGAVPAISLQRIRQLLLLDQ
jgi:hypothetical protein